MSISLSLLNDVRTSACNLARTSGCVHSRKVTADSKVAVVSPPPMIKVPLFARNSSKLKFSSFFWRSRPSMRSGRSVCHIWKSAALPCWVPRWVGAVGIFERMCEVTRALIFSMRFAENTARREDTIRLVPKVRTGTERHAPLQLLLREPYMFLVLFKHTLGHKRHDCRL